MRTLIKVSDAAVWDQDQGIKENRLEWVEALESGRYKQAQSKLRDGDAFCCLGVQCDLAAAEGTLGEWENGFVFRSPSGRPDDAIPQTDILFQFGMSHSEAVSFAHLNDAGWTFRQIAFKYRTDHILWDNYVPRVNDNHNRLDYTPVARGSTYQ